MTREIVKIIKEICKEEKIAVHCYSDDYILQLEKNHRTMLIYGNKFPNNSAAIEQVCNDKAALSDLLEYYNIPHVKHTFFNSPTRDEYCPINGNWNRMQKILKECGVVVCKPTRGTGGSNIFKVTNKKELENAVLQIFKGNQSLCISPYYDIKNEYRVLMLGDEVQYIFKKIRPYVIGDGHSNLRELCNIVGYNDISILPNGLQWEYVPNDGDKVELSWKHNLGLGATPELVTDITIKSQLTDLAKRCVSALDLGFVSVDIIETNNELLVLEINSGVMVENFAKSTAENRNLVKESIKKAIQQYLHLDTKYYLKRSRVSHLVLPLLYKIAKKKGIQIIEDKEEGNFAIFIFPNGKKFVAKDYPFNINVNGSSHLSANKSACNSFLKNLGYCVPKEKYFIRKPNIKISLNEIERNIEDANSLLGFNFPIVVKPNNLSQGIGVFVAHNKDECIRFSREAFLKSKIILLQEFCVGKEYRIVVLNKRILQAYQRVPFSIIGDGQRDISSLLQERISEFKQYGRDKDIDIADPRISKHVFDAGYGFNSVLEKGVILKLQDIANLSLGGTSIDVLDTIDKRFQDLAIEIASNMNMNLCGIDIIADDIENIESGYKIIEINSSPGLDNYLYLDRKKQDKYVEKLYSQVLEELQYL